MVSPFGHISTWKGNNSHSAAHHLATWLLSVTLQADMVCSMWLYGYFQQTISLYAKICTYIIQLTAMLKDNVLNLIVGINLLSHWVIDVMLPMGVNAQPNQTFIFWYFTYWLTDASTVANTTFCY